ncbi:uncharacterized protein BX664DRAFT_88744 [Halteromyces radiatus]|uniref:uncharacterized protein n=1 Tax=Halteromyces radiatus TaxID=101107 RepID=UPI00221FFB8A|nr:uncharacterized protein BX664DRAFT_88744 [Halteromyces radiatus]KAI8092500.1 hypothetical protein BX664DRAFT_88744 [Halteromyces radiatus]
MSDHNESINQFIAMTGVSKEQAKFFVEMANGDIEMALTQYYDNSNESSGPSTPAASSSLESSAIPSSSAIPAKRSTNASRSTKSSNIRTLNDVATSQARDEDDDEPQNFFAGGEKSGMLVQDPTKRGKNSNLVDEILKKAAAGGPAPEESSSDKASKPTYFTGSGYTLGSEDEPSVMVNSENPAESSEESLPSVVRYLTFWRNGFSVDDGPLLRYDDPANSAMLSSINSGRAPLSLLNVKHGQPVDVRVARRQDEDYVPPPKAPPKPFEGTGNRLGSPAPSSPSISSNTTAPAAATTAAAPEIDANLPITSVQIRLGDGSRLVAKFNHTHTIGDIRRYIDSQRPNQRSYILQTTFPVKSLADEGQSLKEAGLLNSVVVQRYE